MKTLLIMPRLRPTDKNYNYSFSLGLPYISSVLKKAGYDVDCLNLNHLDGSVEDILKEKVKGYDVIGTGNIFVGYLVLDEIIKVIRKYSKAKIILGGSVVTSDPLVMENLKPDFGVVGEGESTILELLKCINENKDPGEIEGLVYLKDNKIVMNKSREFVDIDSLPFPDLDSFGFEEFLEHMYTNQEYYNNQFDYPRTYSILGSRGCPFQCTFCNHAIGRSYRQRSVNNIIKELRWAIEKYKINMIGIHDDCLALDKERLSEFCDKIKKLIDEFSWDIKWTCQLIISDLDKEILKKMKDSGCFVISYGFESMSAKILKSMKKPITKKQIDFVFKTTLKVGIAVQGNFIFGDIAETKETARETLDWWKENARGQINLCFVQPYPGSEIYEYCLKKGLIKDRLTYISQICGGEIFLNMTKMTNEEFAGLYNEIMRLRIVKLTIPKKIVKLKERYEIEVICPNCKKEITYKNYQANDLTKMICRECKLRFHISCPPILINKAGVDEILK